ncbi:MAG: hypothetical protein QOD74_1703 [Variibacter sp.]|nr:hypothetical protein [Variibacter sp.]
MRRRQFLRGSAACMALGTGAKVVLAQGYPDRLIKYVVGFPPGGSADLVARLYAERMTATLRQGYVIENVPGASSNIASAQVARAEPDGYTLLISSSIGHAISPWMFKLNFDVLRDFAPVSLLAVYPLIVAVSPSLGVRTISDMVAMSQRVPGGLFYATSNAGFQIAGVQIAKATGARLVNVPFKGGAEAATSVIAGTVPMIIGTPPTIVPHIESGSMVGLALTTAKASPVLPGIPSAEEAGVPGVDIASWFGLFAPARTPKPVIQKLFSAVQATRSEELLRKKFALEGMIPSFSDSPEEFTAFVADEHARYRDLVREAGLGLKP